MVFNTFLHYFRVNLNKFNLEKLFFMLHAWIPECSAQRCQRMNCRRSWKCFFERLDQIDPNGMRKCVQQDDGFITRKEEKLLPKPLRFAGSQHRDKNWSMFRTKKKMNSKPFLDSVARGWMAEVHWCAIPTFKPDRCHETHTPLNWSNICDLWVGSHHISAYLKRNGVRKSFVRKYTLDVLPFSPMNYCYYVMNSICRHSAATACRKNANKNRIGFVDYGLFTFRSYPTHSMTIWP